MKKYRKTLFGCYLCFITQAISANFAPLLFLKFHLDYSISLGTVALISGVFFFTQLLVDLFCAKFVDKIGYRQCIITALILSFLGLVGLAFLPDLLPSPFAGIIISVVLYAMGSGLIEVLASPIIEACPFDNKEAHMSLLHSFYCWGTLGVILISSLFFLAFGVENWRWMACIWAVLPLASVFIFIDCPIEKMPNDENEKRGMLSLFKKPIFFLLLILMIASGASELAMAQWASAYAELTLGLSKTVGDLVGPCLFALTMGLSRAFYGKFGSKINLKGFMLGSGVLCLICYLLAAFSPLPIFGLIGCVLCGASVGIMWPGSISLSSKAIPLGGTAMFALLAMAGDLGGVIGTNVVGSVAEAAGDSIATGLLVGIIFPAILVISMIVLLVIENRRNATRIENVKADD